MANIGRLGNTFVSATRTATLATLTFNDPIAAEFFFTQLQASTGTIRTVAIRSGTTVVARFNSTDPITPEWTPGTSIITAALTGNTATGNVARASVDNVAESTSAAPQANVIQVGSARTAGTLVFENNAAAGRAVDAWNAADNTQKATVRTIHLDGQTNRNLNFTAALGNTAQHRGRFGIWTGGGTASNANWATADVLYRAHALQFRTAATATPPSVVVLNVVFFQRQLSGAAMGKDRMMSGMMRGTGMMTKGPMRKGMKGLVGMFGKPVRSKR